LLGIKRITLGINLKHHPMQKKAALLNLFACLLIILNTSENLKAQKIITVAGNANHNGPGYSKTYNENPTSYGIAIDINANIFFSEIDKSTVSEINADGTLTLVAGDISEPGFSGDGGLATNAKLDGPQGISVENNGNIYIADTYNNRIRKVDINGIITTVAGGGHGGDGGLAVNAGLMTPVDVIIDSAGNIYIAEQGGNKIRKINAKGVISTVAGNGTAGFSGDGGKAINAILNSPTGICFDKNGNLLIADANNKRIRKINKNGIINTIAGNGSSSCGKNNVVAITSPIGEPTGIDIDTTGNIYFVATYNCAVQMIDTSGYLHTVTQNNDDPQTLAYNKFNNSLYFSTIYEDLCWGYIPNLVHYNLNSLQQEMVVGNSSNQPTYNGDSIASTIAHLSYTKGVAFIKGNVYFVDANFYRIRKLDDKGIITTIAGNGIKGSNGFGDGGLAVNAEFTSPSEITADKNGNIYISDAGDNRIRKINKQGIISTAYKVSAPQGIAFDAKGNLFYSSPPNVYVIDPAGKVSIVAGDGSTCWTEEDSVGATKTCLNYPVGVYIDNEGNLYISDKGASKIRKVDTTGIITTLAGNTWYSGYNGDNIPAKTAWLDNPTGVTQDKYGNLIITDNGNHLIREIDAQGIIHTIAGGGSGDHTNCDGEWFDDGTFSGDDGTAIGSNLNYPYNVAFDTKGNYFISDQYNNRIREVINNCTAIPSPNSIAMQQYVNKKFALQYNCYLLATLTPRLNYLSALNTTVITNVWVENKVVRDSTGKPFVRRHYQIFPERSKNASSTATFTLYFNQSDFDKYNNSSGSNYAKLPISPNDTAGISNLVIYTYKSKSQDGSGLPGSYRTKLEKLSSINKSIIWNTTGNYWEVSFNVSSLGGFFIGTSANNLTVSSKEQIQSEDEIINVYPNPATDNVYVSLPAKFLYKPVQLISINGKMISEQIANVQTINFNIKDVASGIYLIRFADGEVKKVIVSKK